MVTIEVKSRLSVQKVSSNGSGRISAKTTSENVDPEKFFQVVGDDQKRTYLQVVQEKVDVGRFKFANRVCEEWNGLDDDGVEVGSVNAFKRKLDHHLRNVRGYF